MAVRKVTLDQVSAHVSGQLDGPGHTQITSLAELHLAESGELSFLISEADIEKAAHTKASAVLIPESLPAISLPMVRVKDVPEAINMVLELFVEPPELKTGVHTTALVASDAIVGRDVTIGPYAVVREAARIGDGSILEAGCYVGRSCVIGQNCHFFQGVVVNDRSEIGHRVVLGANSVIGSDGFGYRPRDGQHRRVPHLGAVCIGDDVEIGANSCVDRAKFGFTAIGRGTKIDNLVNIAHNVRIGEHCLIAAQTGIAGSAKLGRRIVFGGQVGVRDHAVVGDGVSAGARTGIHHNVPDGAEVLGTPALDWRKTLREQAALRKLPALVAKVKELQQRLNELESTTDHC